MFEGFDLDVLILDFGIGVIEVVNGVLQHGADSIVDTLVELVCELVGIHHKQAEGLVSPFASDFVFEFASGEECVFLFSHVLNIDN